MNIKKEVLRKCISTNRLLPKDSLIRICKLSDNSVHIDCNFNLLGRGVYICYDLNNLIVIKKKKLLEKNLRCSINEDIFIQLEELIRRKING